MFSRTPGSREVLMRSILCLVSVLRRRAVRDSHQADLCLRARRPDRRRDRHHAVRLHPPEHHVQVRQETVSVTPAGTPAVTTSVSTLTPLSAQIGTEERFSWRPSEPVSVESDPTVVIQQVSPGSRRTDEVFPSERHTNGVRDWIQVPQEEAELPQL